MSRDSELNKFKERLPFSFKDDALLENVFVHSSYLNEKAGEGLTSNERLEFLGDSVLSIIISRILYDKFGEVDEGELTTMRARLVNKRTLARLGQDMGLGPLMLLGKGEARSGGAENPTILADGFEALVGAAYLDGGIDAAFGFVEGLAAPLIEEATVNSGHFDFKPHLQELSQRRFKEAPVYRVVSEEGPAHDKMFTIEAAAGGEALATASASTKKEAEQLAAKAAIEKLKERGVE